MICTFCCNYDDRRHYFLQQNEFFRACKRLILISLGLNAILYLFCSAFTGFTVSLALGLLAGTALLAVYEFLLYRSVVSSVNRSPGGGRTRMVAGYFFRLLVIGVSFYLATECPLLNPYGLLIPLLYPRLIYLVEGRWEKHKNQKQGGFHS